jgi:hypothetical protein
MQLFQRGKWEVTFHLMRVSEFTLLWQLPVEEEPIQNNNEQAFIAVTLFEILWMRHVALPDQVVADVVPLQPASFCDNSLAALQHFGPK